jgi:hypothetical protein
MKKLALTIVCAMAVSGVAFSQGLIAWATPSADITVQTNGTVYSPLFGGGSANGTQGNLAAQSSGLGYSFALLYQTYPGPGAGGIATDTSVWDGTWTATGLTATNSTFAHNISPINGVTQTVPAFDNTNSMVLVGWSSDLGTSWVGVSNILAQLALGNTAPLLAQTGGASAWFGESTFGYLIGNTSPSPGAAVFAGGADANGLPIDELNMQLYLLPVPEPTTLALAGLGGLSLMFFRRQRK